MSSVLKPVTFLDREYASPLWVASGTYGWGVEAARGGFLPKSLSAIVTKGVSPLPMDGAPHPRIAESGHGVALLNAIGLQNPGLEGFLSNYAKAYAAGEPALPVWVNVLGSTLEGYAKVVRGVAEASELDSRDWLAGFELNVSCPNVDKGGTEFGADPMMLRGLVESCMLASRGRPVMVKLSPAAADPLGLVRACLDGGARAISVANTMPAGLPEPERVNRSTGRVEWALGRRYGGLSGPGLRPIALRLVDLIRSRYDDVPISGIGGIETAHDVREFLAAGATVVQVGTANFANPWVCDDIAASL
jgi:dihydroorotate dehydrogenase (NAD+) catalytic subunit